MKILHVLTEEKEGRHLKLMEKKRSTLQSV